jgi:hypothetical protein
VLAITPPSPPRDVDELFSVPPTPVIGITHLGGGGGDKPKVVPVSSLSESDDEDEGEGVRDKGVDVNVDVKADSNVNAVVEDKEDEGSEEEEEQTVPSSFLDLYTANRSCSKCGKNIVSFRNNNSVSVSLHHHSLRSDHKSYFFPLAGLPIFFTLTTCVVLTLLDSSLSGMRVPFDPVSERLYRLW